MNYPDKPFISIIAPCYNEEAILLDNLNVIIDYLNNQREKYHWEILLIDDGSKDKTGEISDNFSRMNRI